MVNRRLLVVIFGLAALVGSTSAFGQSERGSITGIVQDTSKGALPGVSVKVVNIATNSTIELVSSPAAPTTRRTFRPAPTASRRPSRDFRPPTSMAYAQCWSHSAS
jgi:hypothetical protein